MTSSRLSGPMKQMLVAALLDPQDDGEWFRLPEPRLRNRVLANRYRRTYTALVERGLVEYTAQPATTKRQNKFPQRVLTAEGLRVARAVQGEVDFAGCVTFCPPSSS